MKRYIRANQVPEYDSEGNELTPEQSAFFKDSKIRDSRGQLLVCYHSTDSDFEIFDKEQIGFGGNFGSGFYFTPERSLAEQYGNNTFICYLNITNPFDYMRYGANKQVLELMQKGGYQFTPEDIQICNEDYSEDTHDIVDIIWNNGYSSVDFSNCLITAGYDGIFVGNEIIAFVPNQIKVISNKKPTVSESIYA